MSDSPEAFESLKKEIRSVLLFHQRECSLNEFRKDFREMLGRPIPATTFHFSNDIELLSAIPDTVRIYQSRGEYHLSGVADATTEHIQKMVAKQKPGKKKPLSKIGKKIPRFTTYSGKPTSYGSRSGSYAGKQQYSTGYNTAKPVSRPTSFASSSFASRPGTGASCVPISSTTYASSSASKDNNSTTLKYYNKDYTIPDKNSNTFASAAASDVRNPVPVTSKPASYVGKSVPVANSTNGTWRSDDVPPRFRGATSVPMLLPPEIECRIVDLVRKHTVGLRMSDFLNAYQRYFNEVFLCTQHGFQSIKQCLDTIPDLTITKMTTMNDFVVCYARKTPQPCRSASERVDTGKLDQELHSCSEPSSVGKMNKAAEVFQFSANWNGQSTSSQPHTQTSRNFNREPTSWNGPSTSSQPQSQPQTQASWSFNREPSQQSFDSPSDSYNLQGSSQMDEKSKYYRDMAKLKTLSAEESSSKSRADALDTFDLSGSESSIGLSNNIVKKLKEVMHKNKHGVWATEFPTIYEKVTGSRFDLHSLGFMDLGALVDAVPDVFQRKRVEGSRKDWIIVPPMDDTADSDASTPRKGALIIDCSIQSIRKILQGCPEGILLSDFLHVYSINCSEPLYLADLGFSCIEDFLLSISERVPLRIEMENGQKTIFYDESRQAEEVFEQPEDIFEQHAKLPPPTPAISNFSIPLYEEPESIPFDAASPACEYRLQKLPENFDRSKFFQVYTSAILHPGYLYIQLVGQDTSEALNSLYNELDEFYKGPYSSHYQMKSRHLRERAMCAAFWPQDSSWYRALIIELVPPHSVQVFYVDYGTKETVPITMLRYLKEAYAKFPGQAIKSRLAHLKPPNNALQFSAQTKQRMLELCMDIVLMAQVEDEKNDTLSIILCDTSDNKDLFINDILLEEGLAVSIYDSSSPPQSQLEPTPHTQIPQLMQYPSHQVTPSQLLQAQCYYQMQNSLSLTMTPDQVASAMQNLSLNYMDNPLVTQPALVSSQQYAVIQPPYGMPEEFSADESEIFEDDDDLFDEFFQKASSVSKRYVKRIRTSDGYFFHVLIVENEAFVSSGDISTLIWINKSPEYLLERLQSREKYIPSQSISEEGNEAMFNQFTKFHVKGIQKNGDISSLIIYPLKSTISLLNLFGHPSAELRHKIALELDAFNPHLAAYQEVSEVEFPETEEEVVFQAVTDDDKLKRLCIHDLMAMKEGIRQKRNLFVRHLEGDKPASSSTVDELSKLEGLLKRVVVRIDEIKQICTTFSGY